MGNKASAQVGDTESVKFPEVVFAVDEENSTALASNKNFHFDITDLAMLLNSSPDIRHKVQESSEEQCISCITSGTSIVELPASRAARVIALPDRERQAVVESDVSALSNVEATNNIARALLNVVTSATGTNAMKTIKTVQAGLKSRKRRVRIRKYEIETLQMEAYFLHPPVHVRKVLKKIDRTLNQAPVSQMRRD